MKSLPIVLAASLCLSGVPVLAQDATAAIKSRQGEMRIMALNLGVLGAIAKGEAEYDSETAQAAAGNLVAVTGLDQRFHWPEGSDLMDAENTRAKPEIWENLDDVLAKWRDLGTAAEAMATAAGQGPEQIQAAMGAVGGACKACHETYRAEN